VSTRRRARRPAHGRSRRTTSAGVASTAPKTARTGNRPAQRTRQNPLAYVGQVAAAVTVVSTIVGLVFLFRPGCTPQDVGRASISDVRVRQPVTYGSYLKKQELPNGSMSQEQLDQLGVMAAFHYEITGLRGKRLPLRWELTEEATNRLIAQDQALTIIPSTNNEGRDWYVWVPAPKRGRRYYITVTIYQPEKQLVPLRHFDTPAFQGIADAWPGSI
jgi:hypothetical protein